MKLTVAAANDVARDLDARLNDYGRRALVVATQVGACSGCVDPEGNTQPGWHRTTCHSFGATA